MLDKYGVLLSISSLPSRHGIGDFGENAYRFIDFLVRHHYKYWQILPLNPLGPGNSPYMSTCSYAIEPRYISLDLLVKEGMLDNVPENNPNTNRVDYEQVRLFKDKYLFTVYKKFIKTNKNELDKFIKENKWVKSFSIYLYLRKKNNFIPWNNWNKKDMLYNTEKGYPLGSKEICEFYIFCQMIAYKQWKNVWAYAKEKGIKIIADCPFYVGIDSLDCWLNKSEFLFDENYHSTMVSGVPPDAFSDDGQLWGTPIYNFSKMKQNGYRFLINRIGYLASNCDYLRLDHFRAWDTYCVIPGNDNNARNGKWLNGPSYDFFNLLYKEYPKINLIAEDLGELFPSVGLLRDYYNLPGMYVAQFEIFSNDEPQTNNKIVYTGTHDNQTLKSWLKMLSEQDLNRLNAKFNNPSNMFRTVFEYTWNLPSLITIVPLQDLLALDDDSRMNTPGTIGSPNWEWKLENFNFEKKLVFGS